MSNENFDGPVNELIQTLGLKPDFFNSLIKEDDWSFILKLHALIEAAATHLLVEEFGKEELGNIFSKMELSEKNKGKIAFIKELNLLDDKYRQFIRKLSEIRNFFIHEIKNVELSIESYLKKLDPQQKTSFFKAITLNDEGNMEIRGISVPIKDFFEKNPKIGAWLAALDLLTEIYFKKEHAKLKFQTIKLKDQFFKQNIDPRLLGIIK